MPPCRFWRDFCRLGSIDRCCHLVSWPLPLLPPLSVGGCGGPIACLRIFFSLAVLLRISLGLAVLLLRILFGLVRLVNVVFGLALISFVFIALVLEVVKETFI